MMRVMVLSRSGLVLLTTFALVLGGRVQGAHALLPAFDAAGGNRQTSFAITPNADNTVGASVADVGDVDGDGQHDVAVVFDSWLPTMTPSVWVPSSSGPAHSSPEAPGWRGLRIVGNGFGTGVAGLGDVNGDGIGDLAVALRYNEIDVVFGRRDGGTVDTRDLGDDGFRIVGPEIEQSGHGAGALMAADSIVSAGDQNGDGRPDLAFLTMSGARVVYTPSQPAGAIIDLTDPATATAGFTLRAGGADPASRPEIASIGNLGDLDGDARDDLLVGWMERRGTGGPAALGGLHGFAFLAGAVSPGAGGSVDLQAAPAAGQGFLLTGADRVFTNAITIGDQNGDGRRDVVLDGYYMDDTGGLDYPTLAYAPPLGTVGSFAPMRSGGGVELDRGLSGLQFDAGDQDGDGVDDLGDLRFVRHSAAFAAAGGGFGPPGSETWTSRSLFAGALPDRNGDGRPELLAVRTEQTPGSTTGRWILDTYLSTPTPVAGPVDEPVFRGGRVTLGATFTLPATPAVATLPAHVGLLLTDPAGQVMMWGAEQDVDAAAGPVHATQELMGGPAGLADGTRYSYRFFLETNAGFAAFTAPASFVFYDTTTREHAFGAPMPAVPQAKTPPTMAPSTRTSVRTGTKRRDVLTGTNRADILRGLGGDDVLRGLAGADRLDGGTGADHIVGGAGRDTIVGGAGNDDIDARDGQVDVIRCGAGKHDRTRADKRDRVSGCERVVRRR
jgi:hypothetical protein